MEADRAKPKDIDEYIAAFSPEVQSILETIRMTVKRAAPEAVEVIRYHMPAITQAGVVVFFAAFKKHIGLYPPVAGDAELVREAAVYAGDKGNLRFPLDQPIPYDLIGRIVQHRVTQNVERAAAKRKKRLQVAVVPS